MQDLYYSRSEVSNSDLSWLKNQLSPRDMPDPSEAYQFGSLIDAMITEPERIDYIQNTLDGCIISPEKWMLANEMKRSFYRDPFCSNLRSLASGQSVMFRPMSICYKGVDFDLDVRCKWDFWIPESGWGADLKSTTATTQQQFEAACKFFDYDRQRAWYMDIAGSDRDILIGISKKNFKIFQIPIQRGDSFYNSGKAKYQELAFKWWAIFKNGRPEVQ